jgi:hypothetical protein
MSLTNPYTQQNPLSKPLYNTQPIKAGDVTVTTNKPVLVEPIKGDYKPLPIEEKSFWKRITKTQKGLIIGGAIAIVVAIVVSMKKK